MEAKSGVLALSLFTVLPDALIPVPATGNAAITSEFAQAVGIVVSGNRFLIIVPISTKHAGLGEIRTPTNVVESTTVLLLLHATHTLFIKDYIPYGRRHFVAYTLSPKHYASRARVSSAPLLTEINMPVSRIEIRQ
ncbi:MAG TPA: hypothetical protein VIH18_07980 [Candidatus Binatia bacterium]|jgi:hypothetical protein